MATLNSDGVYNILPEYRRTIVSVNLDWDERGEMIPRKIYWRDGRAFDLNVISRQRRPATKAGGCGIRYTVRVTYRGMNLRNNITYLFFEDGAEPETWFVEEEVPFDS